MIAFLVLSFSWVSITSLYYGLKISKKLKEIYSREREENYMKLRRKYLFYLTFIFVFFIIRSGFAILSIYWNFFNLFDLGNFIYFLFLEVVMIFFFVLIFRKNKNVNQFEIGSEGFVISSNKFSGFNRIDDENTLLIQNKN